MRSGDGNKILKVTTRANFYEIYWQSKGAMKMKPRYYIFASWIKSGNKILDISGGDGVLGEFLRDNHNVREKIVSGGYELFRTCVLLDILIRQLIDLIKNNWTSNITKIKA